MNAIPPRLHPRPETASTPAGPDEPVCLSQLSLFQDLSGRERARLVAEAPRRAVAAGAQIWSPLRPFDVLFAVRSGRARLYRPVPDGREITTALPTTGSLFGKMPLIGLRMADSYAVALEPLELCLLSRGDVAVVVAWRTRSWVPITVSGAGLVLLAVFDNGVKMIVARPRPPLAGQAMTAHGLSFPSGHALWSAGVALLVVVLVGFLGGDRVRSTVRAAALVVTVVISGSRLVVAVHYPSDVLAGWCLAVLAVGIVAVTVTRLTATHSSDQHANSTHRAPDSGAGSHETQCGVELGTAGEPAGCSAVCRVRRSPRTSAGRGGPGAARGQQALLVTSTG